MQIYRRRALSGPRISVLALTRGQASASPSCDTGLFEFTYLGSAGGSLWDTMATVGDSLVSTDHPLRRELGAFRRVDGNV